MQARHKNPRFIISVIAVIALALAILIGWPVSVSGTKENKNETGSISTKEAAESPKAVVTDPATIKAATDFVSKATVGNMFEVESGRVALDESNNDRIRKFAEMMIDHHSQADQELRSHIDSSSVEMENVPDQLDEKHRSIVEKLKITKGPEFDNLYVAEQRKAHEEAIVLYRNYSVRGEDRALSSYATKTLPVIEEHQKIVKGLN